ncbi:MAG: U32 family peptidase, partial [Clostridia bacterium]|nr:U32 family peptidase [Clostridia bacterium]
MNMKKTVELLSPAGSMEALKTAYRFGADAVYLGGSFMQLRAKSAGFTDDMLQEAVSHAHALGKKVYVTLNCFAKNEEFA